MGGHRLHPKKKFTEVYIFEDRVVIKEIGISIPFSAIENVENMDEQRITKTRVFLTGLIVGLLWKKKFLYTVIDYNDGLMDQTIILDFGSGIEEAQHMIYEGMIRARNSSTSKSVSMPHSGAPIAFGQPAKQVSKSEGIDNSLNRETETNIAGQEDPFHILKVRLAKGEISKEEYDEIRKALE